MCQITQIIKIVINLGCKHSTHLGNGQFVHPIGGYEVDWG